MAIIYVSASASTGGNGQSGTPFQSINAAVAAAIAGDTIIVRSGNYPENVIIDKALILLSESGRETTTITGSPGNPGQGAIEVLAGVNDVTIGDAGKGFTVIGFDGPAAIEKAAVYLTGAHSNLVIKGNDIRANGDIGLLSEYGSALSNIQIDGNIFSGQSFSGTNPALGNQFEVSNVPRALVFLGTDTDPGSVATTITFTNNQITGTAGGLTTGGQPSGNTLVTIDAANSTISGNTFTGYTTGNGTQLRSREEATNISNNSFSNANGGNVGTLVQNDGQPGVVSNNTITYGSGDDLIIAAAGDDTLDGGAGNDTLDMRNANGAMVDLASGIAFSQATGTDRLVSIENVRGSAGADLLYGDGNANTFYVTGGGDQIDGRGGIDTIDMTAAGVAGSNGASVDLAAGRAFSSLTGITTITNIENVRGSVGNDILSGDANANTFYATVGNDTIDGRDGIDTYDASTATSSVIVNLATGAVSGAFSGTIANVENVTTGSGNDVITGTSGANVLSGGDGNDVITGGGGCDIIVGGAGIDTANFAGLASSYTIANGSVAGQVLVTRDGVTSTVSGVEKLAFEGGNVFIATDAASLTYALANAGTGDTIKLADGTYTGNFTIATDGLTIESLSGNAANVVLKGTFRSDNNIPSDQTVGDWVVSPTSYSGAAGAGLTIAAGADGVTIRGITVREYLTGIEMQSNDGLTLDGVIIDESVIGVSKTSGSANVTDFTMTGGRIEDGYIGINVAADAANQGQGSFDNVTINGTNFLHLAQKGIYVEQLSHAVLTNLVMNDVGQFGGGRAFGAFGANGAGIDVNLKYGNFSDISISDFDFTNVGSSNQDGAAASHVNGGAILIKARDDGSYSTNKATLTGVTIEDGSIDGTSTGIRYGEPGKNTAGATNVTVENVDVTGAGVGSYDNQTTTQRTVTLSADADTVTTSAASTGGFHYIGLGGNDSLSGGKAADILDGGAGNDTLIGGDGIDTAIFTKGASAYTIAKTATGYTVTDNATNEVDTVSGVEQLEFAGSKVLVVGGGGYGSIQAAIDAASSGDVIYILNGTYTEQVEVTGRANLTIRGESEAGVIIKAPATGALEQNATDAVNGRLQHAIVAVSGSTNVNIENLTIDGANRANGVSGGNDFVGVAVANSTGSIDDVTVSGIRDPLENGEVSGNQRGNAIVISNTLGSPHAFSITDSTIENFQKTGIIARNTDVTISGNEIDGGGPHGIIGQNGIQLSSGSTGDVTGNTIDGIGYTPGTVTVVGILVFSTTDLTVSGNTFNGTGDSDAFVYLADSTGAHVSGNTINAADYGVIDSGAIGEPNNDVATNTYNNVEVNVGFYPNANVTVDFNVSGTAGNDDLNGAAGNDTFSGLAGDDALSGGDGNDTLIGGTGNDILDGGNGIDTAKFSGNFADYTITSTAQGLRVVDNNIADGNDGTDLLVGVEALSFADSGTGRILYVDDNGGAAFTSIQAAVDAAHDGDKIIVLSGTYTENVTIDNLAITIVGANQGVTGSAHNISAESSIVGRVVVKGSKDVTLDGLEFRATANTGTVGPSNPALNFQGTGDYVVTNSVFYNETMGGANGVEARAIGLYTNLSGGVTIENNLFTGTSTGDFDTAPWYRGVWSDGTSSDLNILNNTFLHVRSSMNLDSYNNVTHEVAGNTFASATTGIAVGAPTGSSFTGIHDNTFGNVSEDFNFRNVTTPITVDLSATNNASTGSNVTVLLGGQAGDTLTGTAGADYIVADGFVAPDSRASTLGGNDIVNAGAGNDTVLAGIGNDVINGGAGSDTIDGGAGIDTANGYAANSTLSIVNGKWTVTTGSDVDTLTNVEKVTIGAKTYLLVDKQANGGFHSVQDAVNAAASGDTILIAPGTYDEDGHGDNINRAGLQFDTPNLTLQGVDANGALITSSSQVLATIRSTFGAGNADTIRVSDTATGLTVNGLGFDEPPTVNSVNNGNDTKSLIGVFADGVTISNSTFATGKASYAVEINGDNIHSYTLTGNQIGSPVWILQGAGDGGTDEVITNNTFFGTASTGTQSGIFIFGGNVAGYAPLSPSLPGTVTGNTFVDGLPVPLYVRTNNATDQTGLLTKAYVESFAAANLSGATDTYAYVIDAQTGEIRLAPSASAANSDAFLASSIEVLNAYQTTGVTVGSGTPVKRDTISSGDTIVTKTVGATNVTLYDENLKIKAQAGSDDLNLTLASGAFSGAPAGATGAVQNVTLLDYATGLGANVDVTGNGLANAITGNSGNNVLAGGGGNDIIKGGAGFDTIQGGDGDDDTALYDGTFARYTITQNGSSYSVTDRNTGDVDIVSGVESFQFGDTKVTASAAVSSAPTITLVRDADDSSTTITVVENADNAPVATVVASDANLPAGDSLTFTLVTANGGTYDGPFEITKNAGSDTTATISTTAALDFETIDSYDVYVKVTDTTGRSVIQMVTVNVQDQGEGPGGSGTQNVSVEQGVFEAPLGIVPLEDPDGDDLTYTITALPSGGTVRLANGDPLPNRALNRLELAGLTYTDAETGNGGVLSFTASDGTNETTLTINLSVDDAESKTYDGTGGNDRLDGAAGDDVVNGLAGNDTLYGGSGTDQLNGGTGLDIMIGGTGNDLYYVDNAGDLVFEAANGGTADRVKTDVSYTLGAGQAIEILSTVDIAGHAAIDLTGNEFANTIYGNAGANVINGRGGGDSLRGAGGNDLYYVDNANDKVIENTGDGFDRVKTSVSWVLGSASEVEFVTTTDVAGKDRINLTGNEKAQTILANDGVNVLDGKGGADLLRGFGGADTFAFSTALSPNNVDHIVDFVGAEDTITLSKSIFKVLPTGGLSQAAFKDLGVTGATVDSSDRILYNSKTGVVSYDADGSGSIKAVQFAVLDNHAKLTFQDFDIV